MKFHVLTIFPEYFSVLNLGIIGRAIGDGKFSVNVVNIRDFSQDKHKKTDDYPYGGGAGMVMTPDPIVRAIEATDPEHKALRIYLSPKGERFCQSVRRSLRGTRRYCSFAAVTRAWTKGQSSLQSTAKSQSATMSSREGNSPRSW